MLSVLVCVAGGGEVGRGGGGALVLCQGVLASFLPALAQVVRYSSSVPSPQPPPQPPLPAATLPIHGTQVFSVEQSRVVGGPGSQLQVAVGLRSLREVGPGK